jgi:hypothetical protein
MTAMYRFLALFLVALTAAGQTPTPNQALDKPPQDVDDALRARIKQFYDFHVAGKYRQAEQLIAEESKDDFYGLSKPELHGYKIGSIEYSENFTNAKVVIIGALPVLLAWAGGKIMDMPFASYWKIENGLWCWYYNKEALRHTPFGEVKTVADPNAPKPNALPVMPTLSLDQLQSALKIDRTSVELSKGKPASVKVTNTLPGPASLTVVCPIKALAETGITATFDKKDLKGGETATLNLVADANTKLGYVPLQIVISPTNQVLNLTVRVSHE